MIKCCTVPVSLCLKEVAEVCYFKHARQFQFKLNSLFNTFQTSLFSAWCTVYQYVGLLCKTKEANFEL